MRMLALAFVCVSAVACGGANGGGGGGSGGGGGGGAAGGANPFQLGNGSFLPAIDALGVNDAGQIVGYGQIPGQSQAAIYWPSSTSSPARLSSGSFAAVTARGINTSGQVVGVSGYGSSQIPVYWASLSGDPVQLSSSGFSGPSPIGINDNGQIVGASVDPVAIYWPSSTSTPSGLVAGSFGSVVASGINNAGQIVGSGKSSGVDVALYWSSPTATPVALSSGSFTMGVMALGISNAGQIVGAAHSGSSTYGIPIYWDAMGNPTALPNGAFNEPIAANGVNASGLIVGGGTTGTSNVALAWTSTPTSTIVPTIYAGSFNGSASFSRVYPATTCTYTDTFSGNITVSILVQPSGAYAGTATVDGTFASHATGGSVPAWNCVDSSTPWKSTNAISGSSTSMRFDTTFVTPAGSNVTGAVTATRSASSIDGTMIVTIDTSSGSATIPLSLPKQ